MLSEQELQRRENLKKIQELGFDPFPPELYPVDFRSTEIVTSDFHSGLKNLLEKIKGIGKQTADQLLQHFRSVKKVSATTEDELAEIVGPAKAKIIFHHFHS